MYRKMNQGAATHFALRCVLVALTLLAVVGCQNPLDTKNYLRVKVLATLEQPSTMTEVVADAFDPISQEFTLNGVYLTPDPVTGDSLSLYSGEPVAYSIIERSQIIYKMEIDSDWVGESFDSLVFRFNSTVVGASKFSKTHTIKLAEEETADIGYYTPFDIAKGQDLDAVVQVQWQNTVQKDPAAEGEYLMLAPTFDVSISY